MNLKVVATISCCQGRSFFPRQMSLQWVASGSCCAGYLAYSCGYGDGWSPHGDLSGQSPRALTPVRSLVENNGMLSNNKISSQNGAIIALVSGKNSHEGGSDWQ